ncbi:HD domain-containing protein [Lachnobacterium bovis]|uniref:HD domain-containing protein n=1 Tax=Lachnobacterium bovis DSM 14045 TaxID=1122142 RepID=A0A1H3F2K1_9FIRM|nr:HD domain-containing protein [Lachnobacterium bovis]SDX85206.1 HD domain-containing protein [Lachnobacterium bovis DSM 14045]
MIDDGGVSQRWLDALCQKMMEYYSGDPKRVLHFLEVHSLAKMLGMKENLDEDSLFILEAAAYVHDIGIKPAEEKYGKCDGKLQEQEGPIVAQHMLSELGLENYIIDRICFLVGHHHTYNNIEGLDYQILLEADFLVNMYEDDFSNSAKKNAYTKVFKTDSGKEMFKIMYSVEF